MMPSRVMNSLTTSLPMAISLPGWFARGATAAGCPAGSRAASRDAARPAAVILFTNGPQANRHLPPSPPGLSLFGLARAEEALEAILGTRIDLIPAADLKPDVAERALHDLVEL